MFILVDIDIDLVCTLFIQSIYLFHRQSIIYQSNSIDIVIITPHALNKWSHNNLAKYISTSNVQSGSVTITLKALPTTKCIKQVRKKEFAAIAFKLKYETFIVYIASSICFASIYLFYRP